MRRDATPFPRSCWLAVIGLAATSGLWCASLAMPAFAADANGSKSFVLYSLAEQEQYINHADDRIRGAAKNPFGNFSDVTASTTAGAGPFPGDEAIFSFNLFADAALKNRIGTATFTCYYNFGKNAFCDASFQVGTRGALIANGAFNFDASRFVLTVTGGSGAYLSASGTLAESQSANHAQRLAFVLT
jgi:hypothetical protein